MAVSVGALEQASVGVEIRKRNGRSRPDRGAAARGGGVVALAGATTPADQNIVDWAALKVPLLLHFTPSASNPPEPLACQRNRLVFELP
ncbi:hypothetical protein SAMN04489729_3288 [Amycolatopsis lurida]|nr:hypothetical protein SAMN04489729_3288 [Amycolatopsis lurida]